MLASPGFLLCCFCCLVILYVPGALLLRAARLPHTWAVAAAPLASVAAVSLVGEVLGLLGIPTFPFMLVGLPFLAGLAAFFARRRNRPIDLQPLAWQCALVAVACALLVGWLHWGNATVGSLGLVQTPDMVSDLTAVRSLTQAKRFSSFSTFAYDTPADRTIIPVPDSGMRPVGWYVLVSAVGQITGADLSLAATATGFVVSVVVWPLAMQCLLTGFFRNDKLGLLLSSLMSSAFVLLPWALLGSVPNYRALCALAVVPASASLILETVRKGELGGETTGLFVASGISLFALIELHICAIPTLVVLVVVPCAAMLWTNTDLQRVSFDTFREFRRMPRHAVGIQESEGVELGKLLAAALIVLTVGLWLLLAGAPFMRGVLFADDVVCASPLEAVANIALLRYAGSLAPDFVQPLLGVLVLVGIGRTIVQRQHRWVAISYGVACLIVWVNSCLVGPLRMLVACFWLKDAFLVGAMASLFAVPLASFGLSWICWGAAKLVHRLVDRDEWGVNELAAGVSVFFAVLFCAVNFGSAGIMAQLGVAKAGPFGAYVRSVAALSLLDAPYSADEREFVAEATDVIPPDALVLNNPYDGSLLAFAHQGVRCYWRSLSGVGSDAETVESQLLRKELYRVARSEEVREAVADLGAEYVLKLSDSRPGDLFAEVNAEQKADFDGVALITDSTPGFEKVLSKGNLRLYRIKRS